jgi:hypothetical protein
MESLNEIEKYYGTEHRYYFWLCREIAALQLGECERWRSGWPKEEWQKKSSDALEMALRSLEGHCSLYEGMHHKIAKAAEVAAFACLEFARRHNKMSSESHEAAAICVRLAIEIWENVKKSLRDKKFTSVDETIYHLKWLQVKERLIRAPILDKADKLAKEAIGRIKILLTAPKNDMNFCFNSSTLMVVISLFVAIVAIVFFY